tara:strand:- start:728 stop:1561 length:834 start_codon:yes stop_codon:yes gene_type:complete
MASLGLLGAIGGLGSGLGQVGQFMYNEELDKAKTARLQAIADKEYARARADAVSDMDRQFREAKEIAGIEQGYRIELENQKNVNDLSILAKEQTNALGRMAAEQGYKMDQLEFSAGTVGDIVVDDGGTARIIAKDGSLIREFDVANVSPLLNDAVDVFESLSRSLTGLESEADNPDSPYRGLFDSRERALNIAVAAMKGSGANLGMDAGDFISPLEEERITNANLIFFNTTMVNGVEQAKLADGTVVSGQQLEDARRDFIIKYGPLYRQFILPNQRR